MADTPEKRWSLLIVEFNDQRYLSASSQRNPAAATRRELRHLEHSNKRLQDAWMNASDEEKDTFRFQLIPASSKEEALFMKSEMTKQFQENGLTLLNQR